MLRTLPHECPTCETHHIRPLRATVDHDMGYWFQCESCDRVFCVGSGADDPIALEENVDEIGISDPWFPDSSSVAAFLERYK